MWDFLLILIVLSAFWGVFQAVWPAIKPDPRYPVALPAPLLAGDIPFDRERFPKLEKAAPSFNESALKGLMELEFIHKAKALEEHLQYLAEQKDLIDRYLTGRIRAYRTARHHLVKQRDALRITLKHAKRLTQGLSSAQTGRQQIQVPKPIPIPTAPLYETREKLELKYTAIGRGIAQGGHRAVQSGGVAGGIAVAVAGTAASIATFSWSVRNMLTSDREMRLYLTRAGDNVEILGASHRELLSTSRAIYERDTALRGLIESIAAPGVLARYRQGTAAPAEVSKVASLIAFSRMADAYVGMGD